MINGWEEGQIGREDMAFDGNAMHDFLTGAGFDTTFLAASQEDNPDRDGENTPDNRTAFFTAHSDYGAGDTLVVYVSSHGNYYNKPDEPHELWKDGPRNYYGGFSEWELINNLEDVDPAVTIIVVFDSCHSGAIHDGMACFADVTIMATNDLDAAWGDLDSDDTNPEDRGGEFTSSWLKALKPLYGDPASREEVCGAAEAADESFDERAFARAFADGFADDVAAQQEKSFPQTSHGPPDKVKPQIPKVTECQADPPVCDPEPESHVRETCDEMLDDLQGSTPDPLAPHVIQDDWRCDEKGESNEHSDGEQTSECAESWDIRYYGAKQIEIIIVDELDCSEPGVLCTEDQERGDLPTDWVVFGMGLEVAPAEIDPDNISTRALVCDSDEEASNNWVPIPAFPKDFFLGTARWFVVDQPAGQPMALSVLDASNGSINPIPSAARVLVRGGMLLWVVPRDEFPAVSEIGCRFTTFRHTGDFGATGDWTADITPTVDEPLLVIELEP